VAHECIHFQQNVGSRLNLLGQSIYEGSADFVGELISGRHTNPAAFEYGDEHEDELCREFVTKMNGEDFTDWLYGTSKKDNRPNDLGYWIGYKIAKSYFEKATDKKQAVYDILNIKDYNEFLKKSGYLAKYIQ
jgi:uncharacterized protein YjaZ